MGVGNSAETNVGPSMDEVLSEDQDFDFIAKVLYNHPAIQAVMANNVWNLMKKGLDILLCIIHV